MVDLSSLFDGEVSQSEIERWLAQFGEADRPIARKLICNFRYFGRRQLDSLVSDMADRVLLATGLPADHIVVAAGADSSAFLAYQLVNVGGFTRVASLTDIGEYLSRSDCAVCVPENLVALGSQAVSLWESQFKPYTPIRAQVVLATSVALEVGVKRIQENTGFKVVVCEYMGPEVLPFSPESRVFPTEVERVEAERVIVDYCSRLGPEQPLGYANLGALLGFSHVTPNITLPIFWSEAADWVPLLRRQNRPSRQDLPPSPAADGEALEQVLGLLSQNLPKDVRGHLLFEFQGVQEAALFGDSALSVGATPEVVVSFAGLVRELAYQVHEREPVRSAIMVVPALGAAADALGGLFFQTDGTLDLGKSAELLVLAEMVDGLTGSVLVDSSGPVVGNVGYGEHQGSPDLFQATRYRQAAVASAVADGLLAVFLGDGRVAVLLRGKRIMTRRGQTWYSHPSDLEGSVRCLADKHGVDATALQRVFELAFTLSDQGRGALVTVGDHEEVLRYRDKPSVSHLRWTPRSLNCAPEGPVCGLMACDGATVLSKDGDLVDGMVFLRPPADAPGEADVGKGARHRTAVKISAITGAICITVSVDGEISAFSGGRKALSAWA